MLVTSHSEQQGVESYKKNSIERQSRVILSFYLFCSSPLFILLSFCPWCLLLCLFRSKTILSECVFVFFMLPGYLGIVKYQTFFMLFLFVSCLSPSSLHTWPANVISAPVQHQLSNHCQHKALPASLLSHLLWSLSRICALLLSACVVVVCPF